ncbi:hypothetical protein SPFCAV_04537 [Salmonella enterica subsp. enterica serovar Gallinarum/Pullorum str. FCAV198]|nr:hypothetical protein SPFCAV_04537 [Salmonella enterica subsp. enterica serovar Gallinarum/Pullorum str. FCAV198]
MTGAEVVHGEPQPPGGKLAEYRRLRKGADIFPLGDFKDGGHAGLLQPDAEGQQVRTEKRRHNQAQAEIQRHHQPAAGTAGKVLPVPADLVGQSAQQRSAEAGGFNGGNKVPGAQQALLRMQPAGQHFAAHHLPSCGADNRLIKRRKLPVPDGLLQAKG